MRATIRRTVAVVGLLAAVGLPTGCGEKPPSYLPMGGPTARSALVELDPAKRPHWGMQGADYRRTGIALNTGPEQVRRLWAVEVPAPGPAQVAVSADGTTYLAGQEGQLWHLVAVSADGRILWKNNLGASGPFTPAIDARGETIYAMAGAPEPYLFAFRTDGARKWQLDLGALANWPQDKPFWQPGSPPNASPLAGDDGTVYVAAGGSLIAADTSGAIKWVWNGASSPDHVTWVGTPALGPDRSIYLPAKFTVGGWALVHLAENGLENWRYKMRGRPSTPAVGMDGLAHLVVEDGSAYQMVTVRINGKMRWSKQLDLSVAEIWARTDAMPALAWDALVGHLVVTNRNVKAAQLATGSVVASPVALDTANRRYLLTRSNAGWHTVGIANSGQVLWEERIAPPASYPVVGYQRVYVVEMMDGTARLVALGST